MVVVHRSDWTSYYYFSECQEEGGKDGKDGKDGKGNTVTWTSLT